LLLAACQSKRDDRGSADPSTETTPAQTRRGEPATTTAPPETKTKTETTPAPSEQGLGDAEIAAIASTANQLEVAAAKLAMDQSDNDEVEAYAKMMIEDHGNAEKQARELLGKLQIAPKENPETERMKAQALATTDRLESLEGAEFDKAYIDSQVTMHQQVLDGLDAMLIPNADNAELKALLSKMRPTVATHLDHARMLKGKLDAR
jgi:putative membrane protein